MTVEGPQQLSKTRNKNTSSYGSKMHVQTIREPIVDVVGYTERMTLDVGCGNNPQGTVNCDLYVQLTEHRLVEDGYIKTKNIPNFVRCDALHLPFKENIFDVVKSRHVLEHLDNPLMVLKEWKRVAKRKVILVVPDLKVSRIYGDFEPHLYSWSKWSLQALMERVFQMAEVYLKRQHLSLRRKGKFSHVVNFLLKRILIHFPIFQNSELIAVGYCKKPAY